MRRVHLDVTSKRLVHITHNYLLQISCIDHQICIHQLSFDKTKQCTRNTHAGLSLSNRTGDSTDAPLFYVFVCIHKQLTTLLCLYLSTLDRNGSPCLAGEPFNFSLYYVISNSPFYDLLSLMRNNMWRYSVVIRTHPSLPLGMCHMCRVRCEAADDRAMAGLATCICGSHCHTLLMFYHRREAKFGHIRPILCG